MKLRHLFIAFLLAVVLASTFSSCRHSSARELSEYENASTGDSLLYYYIQMKALEYWNRSASDTALRSREQRDRFLEGVEKGVSLVGDDDIYNKGLRLGVRLANNLRDFEKKYDVDLNDEIIMGSLRRGLQDGNDIAGLDDQKEFYRLLDKMKMALHEKKDGMALKELASEASKRNLTKVSDNLYYKIVRQGEGEKAMAGDVLSLAVDYQRPSGDNLGLPSPITVTVGDAGVPLVLDQAYRMLNLGATAVFATTASSIFGSRTSIMGLEDDEIVIVQMILNDIVTPSDANHPGSAVIPRQ